MQTDVDLLSRESRQKLNKQIERVQAEAKHLRAQARQLRRAQNAEEKKRKKLLKQIALSSKEWSQSVLRRGGELTAAASSQLRTGKQAAFERGGNVLQERGGPLTSWWNVKAQQPRKHAENGARRSHEEAHQMHKRAEHELNWRDEATHQLRRQGQHLTRQAADLRDETTYKLRRQGLSLRQFIIGLGDEITYRLLRQGQYLIQSLADRSEEAAHRLHKQERSASRNLAERKEEAARQTRKQERRMNRELARRRRKTAAQAGEPMRLSGNEIWPALGFISGLLVAGGVTYWLVKRNFGARELEEEENIELPSYETLNGVGDRPESESRYSKRGGTAVAGRTRTASEPVTRFVGVLNSRQYYPIEQAPDVQDVVFFETEDDARAEGFTAGY